MTNFRRVRKAKVRRQGRDAGKLKAEPGTHAVGRQGEWENDAPRSGGTATRIKAQQLMGGFFCHLQRWCTVSELRWDVRVEVLESVFVVNVEGERI